MPNSLAQADVILYTTLHLMCCTENLLYKFKEMFCMHHFWFVDTSLLSSIDFSTHYVVKKNSTLNAGEYIAFSLV